MAFHPQKPEHKVRSTFTLQPATFELIKEVAAKYGVSASRVVDQALEEYLTKAMQAKPEGK